MRVCVILLERKNLEQLQHSRVGQQDGLTTFTTPDSDQH